MKKIFFTFVLCASLLTVWGRPVSGTPEAIRWIDPQRAGFPVVQGQAWPQELAGSYRRLPERMRSEVRPMLWKLSGHSAGLSIHFRSNASPIRVRYTVTGNDERAMHHMPSTGVSGLDLYAVDREGNEQYVSRSADWSGRDTICYRFSPKPDPHFDRIGYEFRLYLPLYNGVTRLEIGVDSAAQFEWLPLRSEQPIVAYGTSILQGACASRPGMAWSTVLARKLDCPLLNFGFSGNGQMDSVILAELGGIDARLYVVDCLPNLTEMPDAEVADRFRQGVSLLRRYRHVPILLVEHAEAEADGGDSAARRKNSLLRECYDRLCGEGIEDLHYLSCAEIGLPDDALVDGIHPSDYGMVRQAAACEAKIREIFGEPRGRLSTTVPVRQRREAPYYEWTDRHEELLAQNRAEAPVNVILGNSIVHFWGGAGDRYVCYGGTNWERTMAPAGFRNMGYGCDRIENVLWRVCHDELDGYEAGRVVLMIGTNNLSVDTDDDIVRGIANLAAVAARHQPQAAIEVIGLLPRRDMESRVARINGRLADTFRPTGFIFRDPGVHLLGSDGRIDESLFRDGLHPNERGYDRIARTIAEGMK